MSIESKGPVDPIFRVKLRTEMFEFACSQGIAASVMNPPTLTGQLWRHAVKIRHDMTGSEVAKQLRDLADWIERTAK